MAAVALAVLAAGCGSADPAPRQEPGPRAAPVGIPLGAAASTSRGAELRAGLTHLLTVRTYLADAAADAVLATGGDREGELVAGAATALDASTTALAETLTSARPALLTGTLDSLRAADRLLLDHAAVRATGGDGSRTAAALDEASAAAGRALGRVAPGVPRSQVVELVQAAGRAQLTALDAAVYDRVSSSARTDDGPPAPTRYALLREASAQAPSTATLLARGIAGSHRLGPADTPASALRTRLTGLLTEQVLLSGALAREVAAGPDGRAGDARAALDDTAAELVAVHADAYAGLGPPMRTTLDRYADALQAYATAVAAADLSSAALARAVLDRHPTTTGAVLHGAVPSLPADATARELRPVLVAVLASVDAVVAGSPDAPERLRRATGAVPSGAALVAASMAEDLRLR